ncbi:MAG: hypothetical protein OER82_01970 [Nitrosopumilus sp.]|nr:hypothetical protein [Nitrosopumilus sp.]
MPKFKKALICPNCELVVKIDKVDMRIKKHWYSLPGCHHCNAISPG